MRVLLKLPPGLNADDTTYSATGRWADCDCVRFDRDLPQTIGGWESLMTDLLTGACRTVFNWTDNSATLNIAFGTHSALQVWVAGELATVTPTLAMPSITLPANPLAVVSATPTVTVTHKSHGLATGETVIVSGATAVGGITPNGTCVITKTSDDSYTYTFGSNATSPASGGGSAVVIAPQRAFTAGPVDGTGGAGYGTGAYDVGRYSEPSTADYFPRTWAFGAFGQNLMATPRGGTIYAWTNNTGAPAAPLLNAPRNVSHMLVSPQEMVFALGCNEEVSGKFNPLCIRHAGVRKNTEWRTGASTTAREYILPGGGRIVAGRVMGAYLMVWTNHSLFLGTYLGSLTQPWRFDRVADKCGLIGPNAAVVVGQAAFWMGNDGQFYRYGLGGAVDPIPCAIRDELFNNLTPAQADKVVAASISRFAEVRWDYPDVRDGVENSRYVALSLAGQGWSRGKMARSAFIDAGPAGDPIGVTPQGNVYWHERGQSADGRPLSWSIETADQYLDEEQTALLLGIWPDVKNQVGPILVTAISRLKPQGDENIKGPFAMVTGDDKVDFRCAGRLFRLRFEGSSLPAFARLGQVAADIRPAGRR